MVVLLRHDHDHSQVIDNILGEMFVRVPLYAKVL